MEELKRRIRKLMPRLELEGRSDPKRIVSEEELEKYLAEGWDVQTVLPSGRILIRKTT
ncbi:MAG: hypothetical protein NXY59_10170 [Aigarchaeota archaeon]|nr:hypothetical protein [Candidatus Pelearchaeum maunauluense]